MNKFVTLLFVAALTAACESDHGVEPAGKTRRIDIVAQCDHSRTSLAEDGLSTFWSAAEAIGVFGSTSQNKPFYSTNVMPASTTTFSGEIDAGDTPLYAYYPYNSAAVDGSGRVYFQLSREQSQTGSVPDIAAADFKIGAVKANPDGTYSTTVEQMMSLLKFTVDAEGTELAGRRMLSVAISAADKPIAGNFRVNVVTKEIENTWQESQMTVKLTDQPELLAPINVWGIINPVLVKNDEIDVSIATVVENEKIDISTCHLTLAKNMQRGDAYTIPLDLSAKEFTTENVSIVTAPDGTENVAAAGAELTGSVSNLFWFNVWKNGDFDWFDLSKNDQDRTFTITVKPNDTLESRTASITVQAGSNAMGLTIYKTITVTQAAGPIEEAANCYIVTEAGSHSFNARVMGNGNSGIITGAGFHTASAVIDPVSAELLWQDTPGFITAVSLENGSVNYTAGTNLGNAMIAVRDAAGSILWSWHIWGTGGEMPADEVYTNKAGASVKVLDRPLGALTTLRVSDLRNADGSIYVYDETAKAPALVKTLPDNVSYCTLYQWGRKDPIPNGGTLYDINGTALRDISASYPVYTDDASIAASVTHPDYMLNAAAGVGDWTTENNGLLWGDNNTTYFSNFSVSGAGAGWTDVKTIYDPCPAGYRVANKFTWTGFDATTDGSAKLKGNMGAGDVEEVLKCITTSFDRGVTRYAPVYAKGYFFMKTSGDTEGTYYPQAGLREADGQPKNVGLSGNYWSSANNGNPHQTQYMTITQYEWLSDATGSTSKAAGNNGQVNVCDFKNKNVALAVRCVKIE